MSPFTKPGVGYNSTVLIAKETTYGVAPTTAVYKSEMVGFEINPRLSVIEDPSLTNTQISRRFIGQGGYYIEWTARLRFGYEGMLPWIRMYLNSYAGAVFDTTGKEHTFKESLTLDSVTLDVSWGNVPSGQVNRLTGCYATGMRITGTAGTGDNAMLQLEITGVAKALATGVTPMTGSPTLAPALGVIFHQLNNTGTNFKDGSGVASDSIQMKSYELASTQPHDAQRYLFGQVQAESPVRNGPLDLTHTFEEEWTGGTLAGVMTSGAWTSVTLTWTNPTVVFATQGRQLLIQSSNITGSDYGTAIAGFGVINQRAAFRAYYNTTDASALIIRIRSTETQPMVW